MLYVAPERLMLDTFLERALNWVTTLHQRMGPRFQAGISQLLKLAIFRPEIVAPFADAMRFVDGELGNVPVKRAFQEAHPTSAAPVLHKASGTRRDAGRANAPLPPPDLTLNSGMSLEFHWFAARPLDLS